MPDAGVSTECSRRDVQPGYHQGRHRGREAPHWLTYWWHKVVSNTFFASTFLGKNLKLDRILCSTALLYLYD